MAREKCVLAYSGGMDSTISAVWIRERYDMNVVTLSVDLGAGPELIGVKERAAQAGAVESLVWDVKDEFVNEYIFPGLKAGAMYEGVYALSTALGRPLMAKKLVEAAPQVGPSAVAHGCTGKGNDQVRLEVGITALGPDIDVIAPIRDWGMSRDDEIEYGQARNLPINANRSRFSTDENLWGRSVEAGELEDPWLEPPEEAFAWTAELSAELFRSDEAQEGMRAFLEKRSPDWAG